MSKAFCGIVLFLLSVLIICGCTRGGGDGLIPSNIDINGISARLPIYAQPSPEGTIAGTAALGVYNVVVNMDDLSSEVVPLRMSSFVPNEYEVDLTNALTTTFCKDCFKVMSIGLAGNGNVLLEVGVKHPFPQITSIPPPSNQRPDLHVFDVQGIVIKEGNKSFPRSRVTLNPTFVRNPDGFTTVFDDYIDDISTEGIVPVTVANAHAFKILSTGNLSSPGDDIGNYNINSPNGYPSPSGLMNPSGFNVMKCGSNYMKALYELDPPTNVFTFTFAITCSFGESAKGTGTALQKRGNPIYLLPAFSKPEAWKVDVSVENNSLADNDNTSTADVVLRVCDWQQAYGHLPADPNFNPAIDTTKQRNTLIKESAINLIELDIPGLNNHIDNSSGVIPTGTGSYFNPRIFRIVVNNDMFASEIPNPEQQPQFWGLAAVRDDLYGDANPIGGIDRDLVVPGSLFEISDYSTYQVFGISILPPNDPPVPVITVTAPVVAPPFPVLIDSGTFVDFDGSTSYDTDGTISTYEWDFDYNPVTQEFNVDFTDPIASIAADPPAVKMNNQYDTQQSKYVALRVTDSPNGMRSVGYAEVRINPNKAPTADLGVYFYTTLLTAPYHFYDGERATLRPGPLTDDDGQIITYQYDFDYDPITPFFTVDIANTTGAAVMSPTLSQGNIYMGTRVIDNGIPNLNDIDFDQINIMGRAANIPVRINDPSASDVWLDNAGLHAIASSNGYIVAAWRQMGNQADIFYSVSNDRGVTWTPQAVLNSVTNGTQRNMSLAARASTNVFHAVYESNETGQYTIKYAISNVGATSWPLQGTVAPSSETPSDPSIAVHPSLSRIYVAYTALVGGIDYIYVRTSPDNASTWGPPIAASKSLVSDRTDPCIAFDETNYRVGVAWDDQRHGSYYQIYFNWSDITGTNFQTTDVRVFTTTTGQTDPSLASRSGTWFMTFDNLLATSDIYFTSSYNGTTWMTPVDCTDNSDSQHNDSSICLDATGVIYVATTDSRESGSPTDRDVYVFKSTNEGVSWIRGVRVDTAPLGENAFKPNICGLNATSEKGFVVMYESPDNYVMTAKSNAY